MLDITHINADFFKKLDNKNQTNFISDEIIIITDSSNVYSILKDSYYRISHPQVEIITSGNATFKINNRKYNVKKGTIIIYPPFTLWSIENKTYDFNSVFIDINFPRGTMYSFLYQLIVIEDVGNNAMQHILKYVYIIKDIIVFDKNNDKDIIAFIIILLNIASKTIFKDIQVSKTNLQRKIDIYQNFIDILCNSDNLSTSISQYAHQLNVSPSYFRNIVKQIAGRSPIKIVNEEIMYRLQKMLLENIPIKEALRKLNLPDYNYSLKFFKKHSGFTPSDFYIHIIEELEKSLSS